MSVTRKDIAIHTGLSASTVGMILSGRGQRYSEATRTRVLEAAEELNYRVDPAARSLRLNRSFLLGVLINAGNTGIAAEFLRGVQNALIDGDYAPTVFSHGNRDEEAESLRRCIDRRIDGLVANIAINPHGEAQLARYAALDAHDIPVVEVFGRFLPGVTKVNVDYEAAGRAAARHLIDRGHRRIAMLTHHRYTASADRAAGPHYDAWERYCGYRECMLEAGLEPVVVTHDLSREIDVDDEFYHGGEVSLRVLLAHPARPTAVICYNDLQAYGLIRAARQQQIDLPRQLSIVGYGDAEVSRITSPALTTLKIPAFEVGRSAAATLLELIEKRTVEDQLIQSKLIVRESTGELS